ncbi:hypothetical protein VTI74DRAFT_4611 [Chaetomium olivicolor]
MMEGIAERTAPPMPCHDERRPGASMNAAKPTLGLESSWNQTWPDTSLKWHRQLRVRGREEDGQQSSTVPLPIQFNQSIRLEQSRRIHPRLYCTTCILCHLWATALHRFPHASSPIHAPPASCVAEPGPDVLPLQRLAREETMSPSRAPERQSAIGGLVLRSLTARLWSRCPCGTSRIPQPSKSVSLLSDCHAGLLASTFEPLNARW